MGGVLKYDLTGERFGRLIAIKFIPNSKGKWLCVCDCGKETIQPGCDLRAGRVVSCGCYRNQKLLSHSFIHGHCLEPEFRIWKQMLARCSKGGSGCKNYYDRGIRVCDRWSSKDGYDNFLSDMGRKPFGGASIDRIDNNKGYSPENCRWATQAQQNRNYRRNIYITINGEKKTLLDWSIYFGANYDTVRYRYKMGYPIEYIFSSENFAKTRKYHATKSKKMVVADH